MTGRHIEIRGVVQGVGFRPWIYRLACEAGLSGYVRNDATGVTIEAFGSEAALEAFIRDLDSPPPAAEIADLRSWPIPSRAVDTFSIAHSEQATERRVSIPPDLATCVECLAEIFDPSDRRYRYPFANCTSCGPRFTIARDVPYDRPATTMAPFRMCAACQREYEDVANRRFHAEPNACPACGPRLQLTDGLGHALDEADPIHAAAAALLCGSIVAIKGLGGFHLACDATSAGAVARLRARKRRDEKPFAVMVGTLEEAEAIAELGSEERRLLTSAERPIVLAARRAGDLAFGVAPDNPLVGVMLPYTPLHHLLMHDVGRPLVMTSGNLSDEPLASRNDEALARLAGIADLFLMHDREVETRCDDSVARVVAGAPVVLRRGRGYVPRAVAVARRFDVPVLACGALLKNTFCIGAQDAAYLGPHIGDLENLETFRSYEASIARMEKFLRVGPEVVAHDLHPEYMSTAYALERRRVTVAVQHHHAHVVSAMAEHGLSAPVLGVAFDGTGYGTDGAAWGGEVLLARYETFDRIATLRPVALAGADAAIRHPWRVALALVLDAFDGEPPVEDLRLFSTIPVRDVAVVRQMLAARLRTPRAHGAGRYFDGIGCLVLGRPDSHYEGQIALALNGIANPDDASRYEFEIDREAQPWQIDLRPMVRSVVRDLLAGVRPATISARFHNTIGAAAAAAVREAARAAGSMPVVLTGGCFQNAILAERIVRELAPHFQVYLHRDVPPGDGGIALGQAVIAAARVRQGSV
jgi:hydrogenase maturation protein HypF